MIFFLTQNQNQLHVPLFVLQSSGSQNPVWDTFVCQRPIINKTVVKQVPVHHHFQILLQFLLNRQIQVLKNFVYFTLSSKFSRSAVTTIHHVPFSVPSLSLTKYTKLSSSSQKYSPKDPSGLGLTSRPNDRTPCAHGSDKKINKMLTSFLFAWKPLVLHRPEAKTGPSSLLLQCSTAGQSLLQFS